MHEHAEIVTDYNPAPHQQVSSVYKDGVLTVRIDPLEECTQLHVILDGVPVIEATAEPVK